MKKTKGAPPAQRQEIIARRRALGITGAALTRGLDDAPWITAGVGASGRRRPPPPPSDDPPDHELPF